MEWDFWGALLRLIICLPVVVILIYAVIKYGLARNYYRKQGSLQVLEQVFLSPKTRIAIIKVADEYLLIGCSEKDIVLLKQLDAYPEDNVEQPHYGFREYLKSFTRRNGSNE